MKTLSTTHEDRPGGDHVTAAPAQGGLLLALANAQALGEIAYGAGMELALARSGDQVVAPEWIQLFPAGPEIVARDGRRWTLADPTVLVSAFTRNRADLPGDIEHATEIRAPKGEDAPAQAWIKEIAVREDRTTWARVEWTAEGQAHVVAKRYRYVSPAFRHTKDGQITRVTSFALTTQPALDLPALAREGGQDPTQQQDTPPMTTTLAARLAAALGLAASASDDAVYQAATEHVALARDARDPAKFVPAADLQVALTRATTAETALAARDQADKDAAATTLVDQAIADGKVAPASKDHWLGLARLDAAATAAALAALPAILTPTDKDKKVDKPADASGLTAEQKALCRDLGLDEAAYAVTLKEQA